MSQAARRGGLIQWLRTGATLLAALAIVAAIWQRLAPRLASLPAKAVTAKPFDPALQRLTPREMATLPLATRFDSPLGSEHGALTYDAQPFRVTRHLGSDLNGIGGQNSDLGDPIYAAAAGRVVLAKNVGGGWGKMVIIAHRLPAGSAKQTTAKVVQTVYAHLDALDVRMGQTVGRGERIGTLGTGGGQYLAHLHFEVREGPYPGPGKGYADTPMNRINPTLFLLEHSGAPPDLLNPAPAPEGAEVEVTRTPSSPTEIKESLQTTPPPARDSPQ